MLILRGNTTLAVGFHLPYKMLKSTGGGLVKWCYLHTIQTCFSYLYTPRPMQLLKRR